MDTESSFEAMFTHVSRYTYVTFCHDVDLRCNSMVHKLDSILKKHSPPWLLESVPSYGTLALVVDRNKATSNEVEKEVRNLLRMASHEYEVQGRLWELEVKYGGDEGPDLKEIAKEKGLSEDEVIRIHTSRVYTCYMLGFTPGFVYLGDVDPAIRVPRLSTPRTHVKGGSVGIAGKQTGFYGIDSPGGWRIIGRLKVKTFDINKDPPSLIQPGDRVKLVSLEWSE